MLGLTELDDMVCQRLSRHDLTQCAQVNKKWHSIVIPRLWHDVSWISLSCSPKSIKAFCDMILQDYLTEKQYQESLNKEHGTENYSQAQPSRPLSTLSKYGHWIQNLPPALNLEEAFRMPFAAGKNDSPTFHQLFLHLLKRCSPQVQITSLSVNLDDEQELDPNHPKRMVLDFGLPHLRHLIIEGTFKSPSPGVQHLMDLLGVLDRHVTTLACLELDLDLSNAGTVDIKEDRAEDGSKVWISLKQLSLTRYIGNADANVFLTWLLKRCASLERLEINGCSEAAQGLLRDMLTHLPKLSGITFGDDLCLIGYVDDDMMAQLLSATTNRWREVKFCSNALFGKATMDALSKHFSSLMLVDMGACRTVTSDQLIQMLRSSTQLHTFLKSYWSYGAGNVTNIKAFTDVDPGTGTLKPWQCEKSLKVFKAEITGVPRTNSADSAQARQLHGQLYDRLARLTNLETLRLGDRYSYYQSDCLEMSLESGLDRLSGLSKLKKLDITRMDTRIGIKEVQWMTEHWPRLRVIYGLGENGKSEEAVRWLQENRPDIELRIFQVPMGAPPSV